MDNWRFFCADRGDDIEMCEFEDDDLEIADEEQEEEESDVQASQTFDGIIKTGA